MFYVLFIAAPASQSHVKVLMMMMRMIIMMMINGSFKVHHIS